MTNVNIRFSDSDIDFTIERFAYYGEGKANAKRVISDLCEYFGIADNHSNHKLLSNKIRTFNPNRNECTEHYRECYRTKRNHNLNHRHDPDGIYSKLKHRTYLRAIDVLCDGMTPSLALKFIEAENRFAIEQQDIYNQERIERDLLAAETGIRSLSHGETEPDSRKPQSVSENLPRKP